MNTRTYFENTICMQHTGKILTKSNTDTKYYIKETCSIKTQLVEWLSWVGTWLLSKRSLVRFLPRTVFNNSVIFETLDPWQSWSLIFKTLVTFLRTFYKIWNLYYFNNFTLTSLILWHFPYKNIYKDVNMFMLDWICIIIQLFRFKRVV